MSTNGDAANKQEQPKPQPSLKDTEVKPTDNQPKPGTQLSPQPNEQQTRRATPIEKLTVTITGVGVFVGIGVLIVYIYQLRAMREGNELTQATIRQMQEQIAVSERPWVKVTVAAGPMRFNEREKTISIDFKFTMTNVGKSVALDVAADGELFLLRFPDPYHLDEGIRRQQIFCDGRPDNAASPQNPFPLKTDSYLFPGDVREFTVGTSSKSGELERESSRYSDSGEVVFEPYFTGCVRYRFSFQGDWHHTFVNYKVAHFGKALPNSLDNIQFKLGRNYPADEIVLFPSFQGGNYVD
jgi:hypothetical protein